MRLAITGIMTAIITLIFVNCNRHEDNKLTIKHYANYYVLAYFNKDSVIEGTAKFYTNDEKLMRMVDYKNGTWNGVCKDYYPNGILKDSLNYYYGIKDNFEYEYDTSGVLTDIEFYYYDIKCGPHLYYNANHLYQYTFINFDKINLVTVNYDSLKKCTLKYFMLGGSNITVHDNAIHHNDLFLYLPRIPKINTSYSLGLTNDENKIKNEHVINSENLFIDTVLPNPEDGWYYYISCHIESTKDSINKIYINKFN